MNYLAWKGAEFPGGNWQGIEFLELTTDALTQELVVTVHLARPASGMTAQSLALEGGRTIDLDDPEVIVTNGLATAEIRLTSKGDHSPYTVRLVDGGNDPLHPFFAEAQFSFFIDCETGDCRPRPLAPTAELPKPPAVDARNKDFRGFMRMLSQWARVSNPDWSDLAPASQERMLLELLAHHGDLLSYYQDRVANEAFLATASERHSLRQHATLLGYPIFEGQAAHTLLAFETTNAGFVPAGLSVENLRPGGERPVVFYVRERTRVEPRNNASALRPAAWPGATQATIPAGSSRLLLWGQNYALEAGMRLALAQGEEVQIKTITTARLVDLPGWAADPSDPLVEIAQPLTELKFDAPLDCTVRPWDQAIPLRLYANLAEASHGALRRTWINPSALPASTDVLLPLNRHNSIVSAVPRGNAVVKHLRALEIPEGPVIHEKNAAGQPEPVLSVFVAGDEWTREDHLHQSQSFDTHYTAHTDNRGRIWLQFGDGVRGREIECDLSSEQPLEAIRLEYRIGEPLDGNCAPGTLSVVTPPVSPEFAGLGTVTFTNITFGVGGRQKDSLDEIREQVPRSLRYGRLQRAVSLADYAEVARQVAGVSRAAAKDLGGPFNTVLVLVDPADQAALSPALRQSVWQRIDETRMAGREHFVEAADYVPLRVGLVLCVQPGFQRPEVRQRVLAELSPGAGQRKGYFHPDRLTFGGDLESDDLIAFVQSLPGVRSVKATAFCRLKAPQITVEPRIVLGPTEVARLDVNKDFPEHGVLELDVVGLDVAGESLDVELAPAGGLP